MNPDVESRTVVAIVKTIQIKNAPIVFVDVIPYFPSRNTHSMHMSSADQLSMLPAYFVGVDPSNDANGSTSLNEGGDMLITSGPFCGCSCCIAIVGARFGIPEGVTSVGSITYAI